MIGFPGAIFTDDGTSLDTAVPNLTQDQIDACEHRSMVTRGDLCPVARVWLLDDDATFAAVHPVIQDEALALLDSGKSILLLASRREAEVDVREGLLAAVGRAETGCTVREMAH